MQAQVSPASDIAPGCRFTLLPNELLIETLSNLRPVGDGCTCCDNIQHDALAALLNVMQTCRTLHAIGRPILYETPPFRRPSHTTRSESQFKSSLRRAARRFVETIQRDSNAAAAVKHLGTLHNILWSFHEVQGVPASQRIAKVWHEEALGVQATCLGLCTNLETVAVALGNLDQANKTGRQLASLLHVKDLELYIGPPPGRSTVSDSDLFRRCLAHFAHRRAIKDGDDFPTAALAIQGTPGGEVTGLDPVGAALRGMAAELEIDCSTAPPQAIESYLDGLFSGEGGPTALRVRCRLAAAPGESNYDTVAVIMQHAAGHHLASFRLSLRGHFLVSPSSCDSYVAHQETSTYLAYPEPFFGFFPLAMELELPLGRHMSLTKLRRLADASPQLRTLDLSNTLWEIEPDSLAVHENGGLSAFEAELVEILEQIHDLERIDLGIWPYEVGVAAQHATHHRYGLEKWADENGIELAVMGCEVPEDDGRETDSMVRSAFLRALGQADQILRSMCAC